jgi:hypothetical protein
MDITSELFIENNNLKITKLTSNISNPKYSLYKLKDSKNLLKLSFNTEPTSLVVIDGSVEIFTDDFNYVFKKFEGLHVLSKNKILNLKIDKEASVLIGSVAELSIDCNIKEYQELTNDNILLLSDYTVDKPWGGETWFSQNIDNYPYALKNIYMEKGFQSSLQSHKFKSETNIVVDGEANVLYGREAPQNESEKVNIQSLKSKVYSNYDGWSNKVNELHRVIAKSTYNAIEISTPELDDVIRWEDDNYRKSGKIDSEHGN